MHKRVLFLVVVGFIVGCGDSSPPPPPPRPSITSFAASPSGYLPVGGSATLSAVFTGGNGVVIPGALAINSGSSIQVSPSSSTTYTLIVTGPGGSASASATVNLNNGQETIGIGGGSVYAPDGASVTVPFGALDADMTLSLRTSTDSPPSGVAASSPVYVFEPAGLLFARPVQVTLPLPAGVSSGSVYWSRLDGSGFDPIGGTIDSAARTITVTTAHFSQAVIGQASETRTVTGLGQITWISATSRQTRPIDFATQGVEALVRDSGGNLVSITGTPGAAPGTFNIPGVPGGEYILHSGTTYVVTDSNTPDLGFLRGGRPDRVPFTDSAIAHIEVDGLEPWNEEAQLEFYVSEADNWDFATNLFWTSLSGGETSVAFDFDVASCNGSFCAEIGPNDHAVLAQLSPRTSSTGLQYFAMTRLVEFPSFSLASGGSVNLSGTMRDVSQDHSIAIDFRGSQWGEVVAGAHPMAQTQCGPPFFNCFIGILGQAGSAEDGFYTANADPLTIFVDGFSDLETGSLQYGTPAGVASGNWGLLFDVRVGAGFVPAPLPGSVGLAGSLRRGIFNGIEWTTSPAAAETAPVVPPLSMVRSPKIAGQDLFTATSGVGLRPTISWSEPAIGQALFYRLDVYKLVINAQNRTVHQRVASLITRNTSVDLPDGILAEGVSHVISIGAVAATSERAATVFADAPFKAGIDRASTSLTSGVLTP